MSLRELFHQVKSLGEPGRCGARGGEAHRSLHPSWPAGIPPLGMKPCWSTQPQPSQPRAEQRCRQPVDSLRDICAFKPVSFRLLLFSSSVVSNSFVTLWTVSCRAPLSMGFPRQEYWSRLPIPSPGDLPDPGIEPVSPALQMDFFFFFYC